MVRIEAEHLRIVTRNLISNAIKFTNTFGEIVIYSEENPVTEQAIIYVQDNGIGIPLEKHAIVFSYASRMPRRGTVGESGSGLGLAFCKDLIEKSGGRIGFFSQPGLGSTFYITLPMLVQQPAPQASQLLQKTEQD
ncbi:sensor histidine kinase [Rhodoflexus sp.]